MKNITKAIVLLSSLAIVSGCNTTKSVEIKTIPVERKLTKQPAPRGLTLSDLKFIVVTANNFEEVKNKFMNADGSFIIYAMVPNDYKKLLKNQAELKRYIEQQKSIIVYYEKVL